MNTPKNLFYTKEHIWIKSYKDNQYSLGITNFAQDLLGDIIYIDLTLGKKFNSNDSIGTIESVKTASDIIAPANGEIILINQDTLKNPEKINESPHEAWLCRISLDLQINKENYLSKQEYLTLIKD